MIPTKNGSNHPSGSINRQAPQTPQSPQGYQNPQNSEQNNGYDTDPVPARRGSLLWLWIVGAVVLVAIGVVLGVFVFGKSDSASISEDDYSVIVESDAPQVEPVMTEEAVAVEEETESMEEAAPVAEAPAPEAPVVVEEVAAVEESVQDEASAAVEEVAAPVDDNQVFLSVDEMPQFPGGDAELFKWIVDHINYPTKGIENNIHGRVVVQFVVTKTGSIGEVKVLRSKNPDLAKEVVRVVKTLPKFIPGKMNGQAVNVWYTLPINIRFQGV